MAFIKANNQFDIGTKVRLSRNIESMFLDYRILQFLL